MSSFMLKLVGCICMLLDHTAYIMNTPIIWFNYIGRFAFTIFAYQIVQGYIFTKNLKKYFFRLILCATISQIPFHYFVGDNRLNTIITLIIGLFSIRVYDENKVLGFFTVFSLAYLAQMLKCDYGFYGVFLIFIFYLFNNNKLKKSLAFIILVILYYSVRILTVFKNFGYSKILFLNSITYYFPYFIFTLFSICLILLHNNKLGYKTKYAFYIFYPLHLFILLIIKNFI